MGKIDKILVSKSQLPDQRQKDRVLVDLCENVHVHIRDLRLEFSLNEWHDFVELINLSHQEICQQEDYCEGDHSFFKRWRIKVEDTSSYFPRRFQVEKQENGSYHIHYHNFRLELDAELFNHFRKMK